MIIRILEVPLKYLQIKNDWCYGGGGGVRYIIDTDGVKTDKKILLHNIFVTLRKRTEIVDI